MKSKLVNYSNFVITSEPISFFWYWGRMISKTLKKKNAKSVLYDISEECIKKAKDKENFSNDELFNIEKKYKRADTFFSKYFLESYELSFNERIDFVLKEFNEENKKIHSYTNSLILYEHFFKSAKKTLFQYYVLKRYNRIHSDNILKEKVFNVIEDEFFEEFNKVFSPEMDRGEILIFLYNIYNQPKNVVIKYRCWTKAYCIIYILSKLIKNKDGREHWLRNILEYFDIKEDRYEKKKKYHYCDDSSKILEGKHKQWGAKMSSYLIEYN